MIENDLRLPEKSSSQQNYYEFIIDRMSKGFESFKNQYSYQDLIIETKYSGLIWMLRIAKEPTNEIINEAASEMHDFLTNNKNNLHEEQLNEIFYIYVFQTLKRTKDYKILEKVLKVIKHYIENDSPL